jgi:hypothetical protein
MGTISHSAEYREGWYDNCFRRQMRSMHRTSAGGPVAFLFGQLFGAAQTPNKSASHTDIAISINALSVVISYTCADAENEPSSIIFPAD